MTSLNDRQNGEINKTVSSTLKLLKKNRRNITLFLLRQHVCQKTAARKERRGVIKNNEHILLNWVARRAQIGGDYSIPVCSNTLRALSTHIHAFSANLNEIEPRKHQREKEAPPE
jgi:hypothetical protein